MNGRDFKALMGVLERIAVALESPNNPVSKEKKFSGKKFDYRASIVGFHNPHKHKGLTPAEFLSLYIERMRAMGKKKDGQARLTMAQWVEDNKETQLKFVSRLFPDTLNENNKHVPFVRKNGQYVKNPEHENNKNKK